MLSVRITQREKVGVPGCATTKSVIWGRKWHSHYITAPDVCYHW
jgi:hypothetical protein